MKNKLEEVKILAVFGFDLDEREVFRRNASMSTESSGVARGGAGCHFTPCFWKNA